MTRPFAQNMTDVLSHARDVADLLWHEWVGVRNPAVGASASVLICLANALALMLKNAAGCGVASASCGLSRGRSTCMPEMVPTPTMRLALCR